MKKATCSGEGGSVQRQRQLIDVIRTFALYEKAGVFGDLSPKDEAYEGTVCQELATQLSIDINGARKVFKLSGLIHNEEACELMKANSRLGVFSSNNFTKGYSSISKGGGNLCIEFLKAFINGEDPQFHEVKLSGRADRRKLDDIALSFRSHARDAFVVMFFKSVSIIGTLCSFVSSDVQKRDIISLGDIVQRFLSGGWNSYQRQRTYHKEAVVAHLVDGWHIVSEVFKVAAQELRFLIISNDDVEGEVLMRGETRRVDLSDLHQSAHRICEALVTEFAAWGFHLLCAHDRVITADLFLGDMFEVLALMIEKLGKYIGCEGEIALRRDKLKSLLRDIYNDAPTMADVKYDVAGMRPCKREKRIARNARKTLWDTRKIILRARWDDSKALKAYEGFLRTAPACHFVPGPPGETVIPETPPTSPSQCQQDVKNLRKRPLDHERRDEDEIHSKRMRTKDSMKGPVSNISTEGSANNVGFPTEKDANKTWGDKVTG